MLNHIFVRHGGGDGGGAVIGMEESRGWIT